MASNEIIIPASEFLNYLPKTYCNEFVNLCSIVPLPQGMRLHEAGQNFRKVYFPLTGYIVLQTSSTNDKPIDIALIGREGMVGATVLLGKNRAPYTAIVQESGMALTISASQFIIQAMQSKALTKLTHLYIYLQMLQLGISAACVCHHDVESRLAKWLLMANDRSRMSYLNLTHAALAKLLSVRRSAITVAAGNLKKGKLIRYKRGRVEILSIANLENRSCSCYREERENYSICFSPGIK